jgi:uncharacterized membrane protein
MIEQLIPVGIVMVIIGVILIVIGGILTALKTKQTKAEGGFIFWIGPFPIVGATSKTMFYVLLLMSAIFLLLLVLINFQGR